MQANGDFEFMDRFHVSRGGEIRGMSGCTIHHIACGWAPGVPRCSPVPAAAPPPVLRAPPGPVPRGRQVRRRGDDGLTCNTRRCVRWSDGTRSRGSRGTGLRVNPKWTGVASSAVSHCVRLDRPDRCQRGQQDRMYIWSFMILFPVSFRRPDDRRAARPDSGRYVDIFL